MVNSESGSRGSRSFRKTCVPCKARKVRCDGRPNFCRNCERLRFDCSFQSSIDAPTHNTRSSKAPQVQLEKRRVALACTKCRSLKIRCPGQLPTCSNCVRRNHHCAYSALKKPNESSHPYSLAVEEVQEPNSAALQPDLEPEPAPTRLEEELIPPKDVLPDFSTVMPLMDAFFEHLYPLPSYAFLHRKSLVQRYLEGSLEPCLTLALCAVTAQYPKCQPYHSDSVSEWAKRAEDDLMHNIAFPSVPRLQALVLVVRYLVNAGQFSKAFMLTALAARAAAALRLFQEKPDLHFLARETRRRLMWACTLLDGQFSVGLREYETCFPEVLQIQLPCPERAFEEGVAVVTAQLRASSTDSAELLGLIAAGLRLKAIRRDIMKLTRKLKSPGVTHTELIRSVRLFEGEMRHLYQSLAESDHYSPVVFSQSSEPIRLLLVHLSWHQAYCDLYRTFLPGYSEAAPSSMLQEMEKRQILERQSLCLQHAVAIVHLLVEFSEQCTAEIVDFDVAICAYHSARLVLYIAGTNGFAQALSQPDAMQMARFCQSALEKFFAETPMAEPIIKEIDDLVTRYGSGWTGAGTQPQQNVETPPEDGDTTQVRIRQQLAIHSLIRQANFEDRDPDVTSSETLSPNVEFQLGAMPRLQSTPMGPPALEAATPTTWMPTVGGLRGNDERMTNNPLPRQFPAEPEAQTQQMSGNPIWPDDHIHDEGGNDMQLAFNPWMGFSNSLESYGLTLSLDDDYF